ncbi:MAG: SDR family NAD(P)-dependent oxidoreductase [Deltaproteobacteria bacterium]|nr:SDR family NAD(P)-dependent oxidoreductase [Deltaproteobacteria bacterium]
MKKFRYTFEGRVAVITGAGQGIGRGYAIALAERGAKVVVNDIVRFTGGKNRDGFGMAADNVVDEIKRAGGEAVASYENVASPEGGESIIHTAVKNFGRLDILIHNAGILRDKSFINMEPDVWDEVLNVNLKGAYCVSRPAFRIMKKNNYGRIVLTSSTSAVFGNFGQANYASAKLGIIGLMNVLKTEGAKYNIKVNTICPTATTGLTKDLFPKEIEERQRIEQVVPMTLFLCLDQCPVTGHVYYAGMGVYKRVALVSGDGAFLGEGKKDVLIEDIAACFELIDSLAFPVDYNTSADFRREVYRKAGLPDD